MLVCSGEQVRSAPLLNLPAPVCVHAADRGPVSVSDVARDVFGSVGSGVSDSVNSGGGDGSGAACATGQTFHAHNVDDLCVADETANTKDSVHNVINFLFFIGMFKVFSLSFLTESLCLLYVHMILFVL